MATREFDDIYFADAKKSAREGKLRIALPGVGWKSSEDELYTIKAEHIAKLQFTRCCRRYQLRIHVNSSSNSNSNEPAVIVKFENFNRDAYDELRDAARQNYSLPLELIELCVKGMNWGRTALLDSSLSFVSHSGKPVFEVPYNLIYNVSAAKNEVALDFVGPEGAGNTGAPRLSRADQLSEIRFYVPGVASSSSSQDSDSDAAELADKEDVDMTDAGAGQAPAAMTAADRLCQALKARSELDVEKSDTICSLKELPFLTPRGRYDVDMYLDFLRLRGKSYDYKIAYSSITRLYLLPKPGDQQMFLIIGLNPPLRQGQTRYDFLVQQFLRDEDMQAEITMEESELQTRFRGALTRRYDARSFEVVSAILRAVANVKVTIPGAYRSPTSGGAGIKCSLKAQEGFLYALEREILFVPKLSRHIEHSEISHVTFPRLTGAGTRTFDLVISLRGGSSIVSFSNILREEHAALEEYFIAKNIRTKSEAPVTTGGAAGAAGGSGAGAGAGGVLGDEDLDDDDSDSDASHGGASGVIDDDDDDDDVANSDDNDFIVPSDDDDSSEVDSDELDSDENDDVDAGEVKKRKLSARQAERQALAKRSRI